MHTVLQLIVKSGNKKHFNVAREAISVGTYWYTLQQISFLPERYTPAAHSGQTPVHNILELDLAFSSDFGCRLKYEAALNFI